MTVSFRNVDVPPGTPVSRWPYEAVVTVIERGLLGDWALLTREIRQDPWGPVSRQVTDYLAYEQPSGVASLLERSIVAARAAAHTSERTEVAREVDGLVRRSGLTTAAFAERIGTSAPRLSTYRSGKVTPSAALLVRMRRLVARLTGSPAEPAAGPDPATHR